MALNDQCLKEDVFYKLCRDLSEDSPKKLTKPRIGDIFQIDGIWESNKDRNGVSVRQMQAPNIALVKRGEISRPGDFADKLFFINKDFTRSERIKKQVVKEAARKEAGLKGKSARHKQLAIWLK